jgi:hypothetical protein
MRRVTYREYLAWMEWFELQNASATKLDHYLMQICAILAGAKHPKQFQIRYKDADVSEAGREARKKQVTAEAKARWGSALGVTIAS